MFKLRPGDTTFLLMIVVTFAAFIVCAAIEFMPDVEDSPVETAVRVVPVVRVPLA